MAPHAVGYTPFCPWWGLSFSGFLPWRKQNVSNKTLTEDCPLELLPESWLWGQRDLGKFCLLLPVLKVCVKSGWNSPKFDLVLTEVGEYRFKSVP